MVVGPHWPIENNHEPKFFCYSKNITIFREKQKKNGFRTEAEIYWFVISRLEEPTQSVSAGKKSGEVLRLFFSKSDAINRNAPPLAGGEGKKFLEIV